MITNFLNTHNSSIIGEYYNLTTEFRSEYMTSTPSYQNVLESKQDQLISTIFNLFTNGTTTPNNSYSLSLASSKSDIDDERADWKKDLLIDLLNLKNTVKNGTYTQSFLAPAVKSIDIKLKDIYNENITSQDLAFLSSLNNVTTPILKRRLARVLEVADFEDLYTPTEPDLSSNYQEPISHSHEAALVEILENPARDHEIKIQLHTEVDLVNVYNTSGHLLYTNDNLTHLSEGDILNIPISHFADHSIVFVQYRMGDKEEIIPVYMHH